MRMLKTKRRILLLVLMLLVGIPAIVLIALPPDSPFGFQRILGGGGPPGPPGPARKLVDQFDENKDGWLNADERAKARVEAKAGGPGGPGGPGGRRGPGGPGFGGPRPAPKPGIMVAESDVPKFDTEDLYDPEVVRTIFLKFDSDDWEAEMADFKPTDVERPAQMTVDGKTYDNVGVGFRGASSFFMVGAGSKRSLNISMDLVDSKQRLLGYKSLNLLNSNGDGTMMRSVLYSHVANQFLPTPKVNFVRVVINGEDWGIYQNAQQFDKSFLQESFKTKNGCRWKVPGSPRGGGGLTYVGDRLEDYQRLYSIKSEDKESAWQRLVLLCKILNDTPIEQLEEELSTILDIDNVLRFLAVDVTLINNDGYWVRASDYNIFLDEKGIFHLVPHDMNESFSGASMGPGGGRGFGPGGPGPGGPRPGGPGSPNLSAVDLDPLVGMDDASKPLRSKLLKVPSFKTRYLQYVYAVADQGLDWEKLGPVVERHRDQIREWVKLDSRKLSTTEAFEAGTAPNLELQTREISIRQFAERRRQFLMSHPEVLKALGDKDVK